MFRQKSNKEKNYQFLANIMREGKVDTTEKALHHIHGLRKRSIQFTVIVLLIAMGLYSLLTEFMAFLCLMATGTIAWAWASTFSTVTLIKMYIERELR